MKIVNKTSMAIFLLGAFLAFSPFDNDAVARGGSERGHHGPPPEAYTACEGKSEGDTAEFESPHGDTVAGTCEWEDDRLVLRPDNPPQGRGGRNDNDE
jgi:hypothetical protein